MALKLGKCRLCLKLGDFYSIFTVDNAMQLSEMVMECTRVKIYEGDGLPDKICSECVQKLSSAYIFKQQCERSDEELRRNYIPPPGFSITPPPPNRQSSDSAFSSAQTDISSSQNKLSSVETITPSKRSRKRSRDSLDNTSVSSQSHEYMPKPSKRIEELRNSRKKPRHQSPASNADSDYEDNAVSQFSGETDSDEPLIHKHKCKLCPKEFNSLKSLSQHNRIHSKDKVTENAVTESPKHTIEDAKDDDDKLKCDKCLKTFKLKIMLKRHAEVCNKTQISPKKELLITLEPIDKVLNKSNETPTKDDGKKIQCQICTNRFKTMDNLEKHMRVVHAAVLKKNIEPVDTNAGKVVVPCLFCNMTFDDFYVHSAHFTSCDKRDDSMPIQCPLCNRSMSKRASYFTHLKNIHFWPSKPEAQQKKEEFQCRMCNKKFASQDLLIPHLAAHMSNIEDDDDVADEDSRSAADDNVSMESEYSGNISTGPHKCTVCDRGFKYKKALQTHLSRHTKSEIKAEPPDKPSTSMEDAYEESEEDSSPGEGDDNTCDICEKQFSYRRLLVQHKKTKHNMSSGHKRAKINLKDCMVRCLICDIEMKVSSINEHNQKHIKANIKPRNQYTCADCGEQFKSCSTLANHIKIIHRLKHAPPPMPAQFEGADLADFCEVVVTKAEPLDEVQSHNGFGEVPLVQTSATVDLAGFTCHLCGKKMKTLLSLKRHVNWHENVGNNIEKKIECFVCKETFRFQCHYRLHMRAHYTDTNLDPKHLTCPICDRRSKHLRAAQAHMNFHKQTRFKNKDYQCSICKRVFQYRKVYLSHMAIHYKRGDGQDTIVGDRPTNTMDKTVFDGTHTCPQCGKVCDSENSLKCHIRWHTSKSSLYGSRHECNICHLQFTNKRRLELHTRSHYEDENGPFKCTICGKGYIDEDYFRRHVKGHNFDHFSHKKRIEKLRKDKVKCPICTRYYPNLIKLIRHLKRTHPESKMIKTDPDAPPPQHYACKLCTRVFWDEDRFKRHQESHLRKHEFFKCKFCGKKAISLKNHRIHIKGHLTRNYRDNPLKCPHCEETFIKGYTLHHHLRDVHDVEETWIAEPSENTLEGPLKEYQCSICLKLLASKGNYERHIDYHNSLKCNYCFDYFGSLKFLEGHLAFACEKKKLVGETETYPKKIKCHLCYKAFHVQVKLDCHLRTQHNIRVTREASEGKQDHICDYCFKVFENDHALAMHKVYHRTVGYYGCIYCNRKFNNLTLYRKHKNHHYSQLNVENPTKCEHCDETFVAFRDMIYHMRDVHNDDKDWLILPKDDKEETCNICNKTFFNLHRHLAYHEENRCKKCGEYFYSTRDYDDHLCPIESDEEVDENNPNDLRAQNVYEECTFCFKPITKKNTKKFHDNLHRVAGAISCRFCPLKFKTMDAFNIHAFSHRSRKYVNNPIKCRICREKFVKYGPFVKHMKIVHKSSKKMHYRAIVKPERCVVCGDEFPNLHNHYRYHLQNQCPSCKKYIISSKLFDKHNCDVPDADPSKVFTSDENLNNLMKNYVPKDEKDDEKFYGYTDDEDEEEQEFDQAPESAPHANTLANNDDSQNSQNDDSQISQNHSQNSQNIDSQNNDSENLYVQPFIISDVLSLYEKKEELLAMYQKKDAKSKKHEELKGVNSKKTNKKHKEQNNKKVNDEDEDSDVEIVDLSDDDTGEVNAHCPIITIDDD